MTPARDGPDADRPLPCSLPAVKPVRAVARRGFDAVNQFVFPEAVSAEDQWQRVSMNEAIDRHLATLGPERRTAVEISGEAHRDKGWKRFDSLNYPQFDLCDPTPQDRTWDVVICEQVLEHVVDPFAAASNLRALCAPNGHLIVEHAVPDQGARAPAVRDVRLLAVHSERFACAPRAGRLHGRHGRHLGQPHVRRREPRPLVGAATVALDGQQPRHARCRLGICSQPGLNDASGGSNMWVLGINGPPIGWHDSAACLVSDDGEVHAFTEEERISRKKHALDGTPAQAARWCLEQAGLTLGDVDVVAYGWNLPRMYPTYGATWTSDSTRDFLYVALGWPRRAAMPEVVYVDHHLAHATSAFYASGFSRASVLVNDGNGEVESISAYSASFEDGIRCLRKWPRSHSLGYMYDATSRAIGMTFLEAGKTMGLAAYGAQRDVSPWSFLRFDDNDSDLFRPPFDLPESAEYKEVIGEWERYFANLGSFPVSTPSATLDADDDAVRIAWSAQNDVEEAIARLVSWLRNETGIDELCIAGGVGLNCSANGKLAEPVYLPPVASDAGAALGAAWHVAPPTMPQAPLTPYLGAPIDISALPGTLDAGDASPEAVADRLAAGKIGAIAYGRAEIGPRALCHRSILAVPDSEGVRDEVNRRKGKGTVAAAVTGCAADGEWRALGGASLPSPVHARRHHSVRRPAQGGARCGSCRRNGACTDDQR